MRTWIWIVAFAACVTLQLGLGRPPASRTNLERKGLLARKELVSLLGRAYKSVLADYYWILETHATGEARTVGEYRDLYTYADLITDLDPDFRYIYIFTGSVMPQNVGREEWVNTQESTAILEKGLKRFPNYIYLRILLGYNYSYFHHEYLRAAHFVEETARLPDAPSYLGPLATRLYAESGSIDTGISLVRSLLATTTDPDTRETLERRLLELKLEGELQAVDKAVAHFRSREGHPPAVVADLVAAGDLAATPADPFGGDIVLDAAGRAQATSQTRRLDTYKPLR